MSHPSQSNSNEPIRPSQVVSVGTPEEAITRAPKSDESGAHDAHRYGFWIGDDEARAGGIPPERRPLSRDSIRNWTIGSVVGSLLFASVVAVALSRGEPRDARTSRVQTLPDAVPAQAAAPPPMPTPRTIIPLESLPISKTEHRRTTRTAPKTATHKVVPARVTLAQEPSPKTAAKSSSRAFAPSRPNTMASAKTTAANDKSASSQ